MKKKLIAIVTSLAMVATMVPSVAFAGSAQTRTVNFASTAAAITALSDGGDFAKTDAEVLYDSDYTNYTDAKTALDGLSTSDKAAYDAAFASPGGNKLTEKSRFDAALAKLNGYHTVAQAAAKAVKAAVDLTNIDESKLTTITAAKTAVGRIGTATDAGCRVSDASAVAGVINAAYDTSDPSADSNRYSDYEKLVAIGDVVKDITDLKKTNNTLAVNASNATAVAAIVTAYDSVDSTMWGNKVAASIKTDATNLKANSTNYAAKRTAIDGFLDAMKDYGTKATVDAPYTKVKDDAVIVVCVAYEAMMTASPTPSDLEEKEVADAIAQLKSLVSSEWRLRSDKVAEDSEPLKGAIVPAKNDTTSLSAVTKLSDTLTAFYTNLTTPSNALYTVLAANRLDNPGGAKALADRTLADAKALITAAGDPVKSVLLAINAIAKVTEDNYDNTTNNTKISNAKTDYAGLTDTEKRKIGNLGVLTTADAAQKAFDKQVTDALKLMAADTIYPAGGVTITSKNFAAVNAAYERAQAAYDNLPEGLKDDSRLDGTVDPGTIDSVDYAQADYVTNLDSVKTKVETYKASADKIAKVQTLIDALPASPAAADAVQIARAKYEYDLLSGPEQSEVLVGNLTNALKKVTDIIYPNGTSAAADAAAVAAAVKPVKDAIAALPATITAAEKEAALETQANYTALTTKITGDDNAIPDAFTTAEFQKLSDANAQAEALDAADQAAVQKFVNAVAAIATVNEGSITKNDTVTSDYEAATIKARNTYQALSDAQKKLAEANSPVAGAKVAYDNLLIAEANVEAAGNMAAAAKLIMAVPTAKTLDVNDAEAVKKVKDAQAAYEALTPGVQETLKATYADAYANYEEALEKVTNAETNTAAKAVIDAINALEKLPTAFESKDAVDAVKAPLEAAEKAYAALTDAQKGVVTNYAALTSYRTNYDALLKTRADEVYDAAAKIDVTAELSAEDIAVASELKAYVEDEYIETKDIAGFKQDVYDALMEALNKILDDQNALENANIAAIDTVTYDGTAKTPAVTVTDKAGKAIADTEYNVRYSNNTNAGTATVIVSAKSGSAYTGSITADFTIEKADIQTAAKAGAIAKQTYNKKAKTPAVTVTAGDKKLVNGSDYTVTYANNTNIGQAKATITGTGNYKGTITTTFIIAPAKGTITSLKAGKKQFTVSYEAQKASGKTGYRIVYSPAKGQAKATQTTAAKKTVKSLKSGKTYKVKVRAYKTIDGTKYNGAYSAVKKVKVK